MEFAESTKKRIDGWLEGPFDEETKNKIHELVKTDPHYLIDAFSDNLVFGTGGIRAKMGIGTNRLNKYTIRFATQGLANYINKQNIKNPSVIIGFDSRNNSLLFARETAEVLSANGIVAYLFKELRPTPLVSFGCRYKKATAAINITASHNPKEYNGYKVYWSDGGQVLPPHDVGIIKEVNQIHDLSQVKLGNSSNIKIITDEIDIAYFKELDTLSYFDKNKSDLKIVYSNLHGTGITVLPEALKKMGFDNISFVESQKTLDGNFPNASYPNPEMIKTLEPGMNQLIEENADIFIATDPDADRVGLVINHENKAYNLSGNQVSCILLNYLCKHSLISKNRAAIKSIVTTDLFKKIAKSYDITSIDVLTGFKYIAQKMQLFEDDQSYNFIFGAEESCGYLIETFARDKDAISAGCLIAQMAKDLKKENKTIVDVLLDLYKNHGIHREMQKSISFEKKKDSMTQMNDAMEKFRCHMPNSISNVEINCIEDYKTGKSINLKNKEETLLDLPESNVLTLILDDDSKIIIRPSGTEPKIKIYGFVVETNIQSINEDIKKCDIRLQALVDAVATYIQ